MREGWCGEMGPDRSEGTDPCDSPLGVGLAPAQALPVVSSGAPAGGTERGPRWRVPGQRRDEAAPEPSPPAQQLGRSPYPWLWNSGSACASLVASPGRKGMCVCVREGGGHRTFSKSSWNFQILHSPQPLKTPLFYFPPPSPPRRRCVWLFIFFFFYYFIILDLFVSCAPRPHPPARRPRGDSGRAGARLCLPARLPAWLFCRAAGSCEGV